MKRASPDSDEDQAHQGKKHKNHNGQLKHHRLAVRQPGAEAVARGPQDAVLLDYQLNKGLCLALYDSGFTTVTRQALSSLRDEVQEYMLHLSWRVVESMRTCRRTKPTAQDFIHALAQFQLTPSSLRAELLNKIRGDISQAPILPPLPAETSSSSLFSPQRFVPSGKDRDVATQRMGYVPKHFPQYPAQHAYHETPVYSRREADPLKIRESVTQEGMQAEQALRKLMAASKIAEQRSKELARAQRGVSQGAGEQLLDDALASIEEGRRKSNQSSTNGTDNARDEKPIHAPDSPSASREVGGVVNYDRMFRRRGGGRHPMQAA